MCRVTRDGGTNWTARLVQHARKTTREEDVADTEVRIRKDAEASQYERGAGSHVILTIPKVTSWPSARVVDPIHLLGNMRKMPWIDYPAAWCPRPNILAARLLCCLHVLSAVDILPRE
ncbi:hypothetical protein LX36DRAFT_383987 [Colletotrichum falcatum]|nr:hypothetical protein LX36DRAFT_383987 [Colletotrichum falcatum]